MSAGSLYNHVAKHGTPGLPDLCYDPFDLLDRYVAFFYGARHLTKSFNFCPSGQTHIEQLR